MPVQASEEIVLASAARFLIDGGDLEAARLLLACELFFCENNMGRNWIELRGPRASYDALVWVGDAPADPPIFQAVGRAFVALGYNQWRVMAQFIPVDSEWRSEFMATAEGTAVDNQCVEAKKAVVWSNLKFRSVSEIRIAQALDAAKVLYWPNCKARLGVETRRNCEADFLVCHKGKFGILEVDGEPYHPATRTVHDHERDRLFKAHGILIAEHFDAGDCFENAEGVVKKFLSILEQAR